MDGEEEQSTTEEIDPIVEAILIALLTLAPTE